MRYFFAFILWSSLTECAPEPPAETDCEAMPMGDEKDRCWSEQILDEFLKNHDQAVQIVEEQISDPDIRDFIWYLVSTSLVPYSPRYCERIQSSVLRERCLAPLRRPHLWGGGITPQEMPWCEHPCPPTHGVTRLHLESVEASSPRDEETVQALAERHFNPFNFCFVREQGACPCLAGSSRLTVKLEDGQVAAVSQDGDFPAPVTQCFMSRLWRWRFPETDGEEFVITLTSEPIESTSPPDQQGPPPEPPQSRRRWDH